MVVSRMSCGRLELSDGNIERSWSESGVKKRREFKGANWLSGPMLTAMSGMVILSGCGVRRSASAGEKSRGLDERSGPYKYSSPGNRPHVLDSPDVPSPT